jgi:hypothetical protein
MFFKRHLREIGVELKEHIPFTALGAISGVIFMLLFKNLSNSASHSLFAIFHPAHVLLGAMVTSAMFRLHRKKTKFIIILLVGYIGSVGIATISDSIIPYFGEELLGLHIPTEQEIHHSTTSLQNHTGEVHLGFIEEWYLVNPAAFLGIIIAWFLPKTKLPHAGHILISTWASSAHVLMTTESRITFTIAMAMLLILFLSTWLPCCFSDIIFPLILSSEPGVGHKHSHCCH